jgi:hypothetical protein
MFIGAIAAQTTALPAEISDKDFWRMIVHLSEPGGTYPYENFISNELQYQDVVPALKKTTKPGRVYIGADPEQNFTRVVTYATSPWGDNTSRTGLHPALTPLTTDFAGSISAFFMSTAKIAPCRWFGAHFGSVPVCSQRASLPGT